MMKDINPLEKEWKKKGLSLREYQQEGVSIMESWYRTGHGGINGDEMGLGKTCQAIVLMLRLRKQGDGPFLVVCPLSVCDHWISEVTRFSCGTLNPIGYYGVEKERKDLLKEIKKLHRNSVFIVPYHVFRQDSEIIAKFEKNSKLAFDVVIVDEAQAIKNSETQLAIKLKPYRSYAWFLLMTGTPLQNHLGELYSLLTFVDPKRFKDRITAKEEFMELYRKDEKLFELRKILPRYMIRRTKDVVCKELPSCEQVIIYHNMTELQKKIYLDLISEHYTDLLQLTNYKHQTTILNLLVQLRKSVAHPYLFRGVEPEPFREGEHLIEASGKLQVLDILLRYLKKHKHRCLIFSQFVMFLDIVDDFMNLRGYKFERIDGKVIANDRYAAVNNFQNWGKNRTRDNGRYNDKDDPWCFLMTTKTGGVGLNLTGADTVIFLDADWNPQNDIQAMARCHRIGQDKPVRVIQLIGRYTVEQHMNARIRNKLKFTDKVMGNEEKKLSAYHVMATVKRNLGALKEQDSENIEMTDQDLESIIGETNARGEWLPLKGEKENEIPIAARINPDEVDTRDTDFNDYRVFEGHHYRISAKDEAESEKLRLLSLAGTARTKQSWRSTLKELSDYEEEDDMETPEEIKETKKDRASSTSPVKVENNENGSVDEVESEKKFIPKLALKREDQNSKKPKVEKLNRKRVHVIDENEDTQKAAVKRKRSNGEVLLQCN